MKHVTIRLADAEGVVLEERTVEGEFASINDCLRLLTAPMTGHYTQDELETFLLEGLEGEATVWTDDDWERLRRVATGEE